MKKKLLRLLIVMTISITALFTLGMTDKKLSLTAYAAEGIFVTGGVADTDYTLGEYDIVLHTNAPITISGVATQDFTIYVPDNVMANITINNLTIENGSQNVIKTDSATVLNLTVTGDNYFSCGNQATPTIDSYGMLIITQESTGSLTVEGALGDSRGGSSAIFSAGDIFINGGRLTVSGGNNAPAIYVCSTLTISGGEVNAYAGTNSAAIGGGQNSVGGSVTISGGKVYARGDRWASDIGNGLNGSGAVFSTGENGNAIISTANGKISDTSDQENWNAIVDNTVYGQVTLKEDFYSSSLTISPNATLIIPEGVILSAFNITNNGSIVNGGVLENYGTVTNNGTLENNGTVTNSGDIVNNGTVEDNGEIIGDQPYTEVGDFTVTGGTKGTDYTYENNVLTVLTDTPITISGTTTADRIEVATGVSANITLAGVNIDVSSQSDTAAFKIADNSTGNVTITLADGTTNTLKSGMNCAGLQKNGEYISADKGKLTIQGTGSLTATGGAYGAGIGGGDGGDGSNITISGGTITATGGNYSSGIGGGEEGAGTYIAISGGTVTATGSFYSAGIGGGEYGNGSNITISGGMINATGGNYGAGIGGGNEGAGTNIAISGGTVTATGGIYAAGIGGGEYGDGSNITISGGMINATGGNYGAGIGGGDTGAGSDITISGGVIYVTAGIYASNSIGGGKGEDAADLSGTQDAVIVDNTAKTVTVYGDVTLTEDFEVPADYTMTIPEGATLTVGTDVTLTNNGTIINNGTLANNGTVINSGTVENKGTITGKAVGGTVNTYDFVITGGTEGTDYTYENNVLTVLTDTPITIANTDPSTPTTNRIEIADGVSASITLAGVNIDVSAQSSTAAFKIADNSTGNVTITLADDTTNTLKSGTDCAGLQKNGNADGIGELIIQGSDEGTGILNATGGGAGIGSGGYNNAGSNITIVSGIVTATGGRGCAGIGGGCGGIGKNITIKGGTVTATSTYCGAGIGGGDSSGNNGNTSNITISGGTVTATGGDYAAGIGGGRGGSGLNITINGGTVTATGGSNGTGIGGGGYGGTSSNIVISGGSVKASSIGCIPTNGTDDVYLLEIENSENADIVINGKDYPDKHFDEAKIYAYLPAKTAENPNEVAVDNETTKYCYDAENSRWLIVVDAPEEDETPFTYKGEEQTYTLTESDYYTISGNKQTNAGDYTVTVALKNKDNTVWSDDGTTDDKEYTFSIAKAELTVTAESYTVKLGNPLPTTLEYTVSGLKGMDTEAVLDNANLSFSYENGITPSALGDYDIIASGDAEIANYTIAYVNGKLTITEKTVQTITADDVVLTYGDTDGNITAATDGDGAISYEVATGTDVISVDENGNITILKAGTATVTVKAAETDTYAQATKTVTVTVNKAAVTVTAKSCTIKVGDTLPTYEYDVTGLVYGEELPIDVTISCTADGKTAGTYDIVVSGAATSTNYTFSYVKGTLTVSEKEAVAAPTFTPVSGTTFALTQNITIVCATEGAKVYYTTDGTAPTTASTLYNGVFTITTTTTIKAIAIKDGMTDSAVVTATYTRKSSGGGGGGGGYTPSRPSTPNNPEIGGKSASWTTIADDISKLPVGGETTVELNGSYDVPVEVIKAVADRDVKVTFIVDSTRSWFVDGAEIETPAAADLSIFAVASLKADILRGDVGTKFRIDGTNVPTELKLTFAKNDAGKFANLYKKDGDKLVFVDNAKIDSYGNAMLSVSEKGDYVVMLCEFSDRKGDVSNDGVTNALDASAILKNIVELEDAANPEMLDYNGDGKVNALDASAILKDIVNGKI